MTTANPLIWDGAILRRSKGITNPAVAPGTPGVNEIPAGTAMDYFMGRIWYAQGRVANAGDIVGGPSGTLAYDFRDSVLNVTECPLVLGGDGFSVPAQDESSEESHTAPTLMLRLVRGGCSWGRQRESVAQHASYSKATGLPDQNTSRSSPSSS